MTRRITQRELRNDSGEVMRALDAGEDFVVTRNGTPVASLLPYQRSRFVRRETVLAAFAGAPPIDAERLREDIDAAVDQDLTPRG